MDVEQKSSDEGEKVDEIVLPGFRFHPTDEELVGFYLKRKIQHRPLSIELIKQLDIYKYDPWDLPKMASTGEKEWYFYCPRDRKYRNSTRPNRVTKGGFWKATGTDRPVYSSEVSNCIGLKKSLVFYKGRAAKGTKTDWMMHEFRLPCSSSNHKSLPTTNESWAICRIFRKTSSVTHRSTSRSWISPSYPQTNNLILNSTSTITHTHQLTEENPSMPIGVDNSSTTDFPLFDFPPYYNQQYQMMLPPLMDASSTNLPHENKHQHSNNGDISCVLGGDYNNNNEACMSLHDQFIIGNGLTLQEDLHGGVLSDFDPTDDLWDVVKSFRFPITGVSEIGLF